MIAAVVRISNVGDSLARMARASIDFFGISEHDEQASVL